MNSRCIDHIVLAVHDLEAARACYEALGFTTTPPSRHPFGTENSLIQFGHSFIELLTVAEPDKIPPMSEGFFSFAEYNQDFLDRREGTSMAVLSSGDARADAERWRARGLPGYEPVDFGRQAKLPDGTLVPVTFTIAFAISPAMPRAAFFVCQQHYPENFWKPAYQTHANGATDITGVTLLADEPTAHRGFFAAMLDEDDVEEAGGGLRVQVRDGAIEVLSPHALAARHLEASPALGAEGPIIVATTIACRDLDGVARRLTDSGMAYIRQDSRVVVASTEANGLSLVFDQI